jgi:hypothetical protein
MPSKKRKGCSKRSKARSSPLLPPDIDTYTVGSTWTDAQREHLAVFLAAINSAAEAVRYKCVTSAMEYGVAVKPSHTGDGVFCDKDIPMYTYVGYYCGVVENAAKFKDDGYSIGIPPITFPDGSVVPAVLSGFTQRHLEASAAMFNHSCQKFNAQFVLEDVFVRKNLEAAWKVQRLLEKPNSIVPDALLEEAAEIQFQYPVVVVMTHLDVQAGEEIRVTYNRASAGSSSSYFSTRRNALKSAAKGYCVAKCMCEAGGCPLRRYYVTKRVAQP